jgi:hypothetical protein
VSGIQSTGNTDLDQLNPGRIPLLDPGHQTSAAGVGAHIQVAPADPVTGQALTFTATGLPPGVKISAGGLITGAPSTAGTHQVTVHASDGKGLSGSVLFSWTVG